MPQPASSVKTGASTGPPWPMVIPGPSLAARASYHTQLAVAAVPDVIGVTSRTLRANSPSAWRLGLKRLTDIVLGSVAIVVILPLLCALAIAIRLDSPGPVLYRS